jgi:release factor glutamine methyltransferase
MTLHDASVYIQDQLLTIYDQGEAKAISDLVIEHITDSRDLNRLHSKQQSLDTLQTDRLNEIIARLKTHEPIQYVINEAWFSGLKFFVDENVLIPRPETEELVEWVIANCKFPINTLRIIDIGSGSGCIPIALRRRLGKADVWGCDVSAKALEVAQKNAETLGVNVNFIQLDFLDKERRELLPQFDIIISNPPYIPESDRSKMPKNVTDFEPSLALFVPDNDPLIFYRTLAEFGRTHLAKEGSLYAEIHEDLGSEVSGLFQENNFKVERSKDMSGKERFVRAELKKDSETMTDD